LYYVELAEEVVVVVVAAVVRAVAEAAVRVVVEHLVHEHQDLVLALVLAVRVDLDTVEYRVPDLVVQLDEQAIGR
jgi:hypothetical protein